MGYFESQLCYWLGVFLGKHLELHDVGFALGEGGMVRTVGGQVRLPDLSFYRWERFPDGTQPAGPSLPFAPDLAVEVLSPTNTAREMARKRQEYFKSGTQVAWEVEPVGRIVRIYTNPSEFIVIDESGVLDGGTVVPGFTLSLQTLFERVAWKGPKS
jgi:Uma2 family endonuclease